MSDDRPPCPKCHEAMKPVGMPVNHSRWWWCPCGRQTYLIHEEGWIVLRTSQGD